MLLTIMTYHYCSCIRVLSSLHVYGFTTVIYLSYCVIYLGYCYGDQLSFAVFACLLRDPRYYIIHLQAGTRELCTQCAGWPHCELMLYSQMCEVVLHEVF